MSDVEKTRSGLIDGEIKTTKIDGDLSTKAVAAAAAAAATAAATTTTTATTLKYQHQHNHKNHQKLQQKHQQQQEQSINYYNSSNASGSAALTDSTVAEAPPSCRNNCISRILKLIFSTPGLVVLVVGYSIMGALIFPLLEAQQDITKSAAIAKSREDCLRELWIITEKLNVLYERNWTMLVHEQLRRFEGSIVAATRNGGAGIVTTTASRNGHSTALGHFGGNLEAWDQARWSFSEALLYSVTVITTIGHGSLTPKTAAGKIATILYAIIGVPLMLMCLSSLGALLAEALQCTYAKLCCRGHETENIGSDGIKRQGGHCSDADHQRDNEAKCHSKGQGLNCKGCKYDAIASESKLHHAYEYNESNSTSDGMMTHGSTEDSCRLLHNSPKAILNHNSSPCMQLKITPQHAVTIAQYYHQQKQQQQQQQQQQPQASYSRIQSQSTQPLPPAPQPDVMLLATTGTPTSTATSATTMARSNALSSPQHLPHQLQPTTTFHIVSNSTSPQLSSSTHSSPLHYNSNHQHQNNHHPSPPPLLSQQQQQQLTMRQYGSNLPQHFVAIPSSMVRFQVAPTNQPSNNATTANCTPMNVGSFTAGNAALLPNCYQPTASTSVAVTGAATIYFPIAGTIGATTTMPRNTTSFGAATSQLLCNQPLVKYHTIQLQHKKPSLNDEIATSGSTAMTTTTTETATTEPTTSFDVADALPLPPPPAYQTATVHGVRRAKFIARPLPPEINNLLAESDVNTTPFRYDLSTVQQNSTTATSSPSPTTTTAITTNLEPTKTTTICSDDSMFLLSTGCTMTSSSATTSMPGTHNLTTVKGGESLVTLPTNATSTLPTTTTATNCTFNGSNVTVDIMEDEEEEQEQQRLGNCPHGTPSRIPLIPNSSGGDGKHGSSSANPCSNNRDYDKSTRGLINATAASFHRHTLQTFQRNGGNGRGNGVCRNNRKSTLVTHQGGSTGNTMHTSAIWMRRASNGCYGSDPNGDTSEDDDYLHHTSNEHFALEQFNSGNFSEDHDDDADEMDDDLEPYNQNGPQVPISIVFLILICYISLGTVIFALWENWSLIDGAYFCFVTLATIGYGDFLPERTFQGPEVQLFACCAYLLLGLVLVAMSFSILETQLIWKCKRIAVRLRLAKD